MRKDYNGVAVGLSLLGGIGWVGLIGAGVVAAQTFAAVGWLQGVGVAAQFCVPALILIVATSVGRVLVDIATAIANPPAPEAVWPANRIAVHFGFEITSHGDGVMAAGLTFATEAEARRHIDSRVNNPGALNFAPR
jgi:hypothetical protein